MQSQIPYLRQTCVSSVNGPSTADCLLFEDESSNVRDLTQRGPATADRILRMSPRSILGRGESDNQLNASFHLLGMGSVLFGRVFAHRALLLLVTALLLWM